MVISGVAVPGYNGPGYNGVFGVLSTATPTTFTYANPTPGLLPGAGGLARLEQPTGGPATGLPFPLLSTRGTAPPAGSEFDAATWRSVFAQLGRINLNRDLQDYPALTTGANGVFDFAVPAVLTQYNLAVQDRQQLASDIFNVLVKVTGALDPTTARTTYGVASPEYQATRWLAQLAVNIVDYIDEDDYMTPFRWDAGPFPPGSPAETGWVFGVELPRLTLNEAYAQLDNDNSDPQILPPGLRATQPYRMNVWLELHNPLPAETFPGQHRHSNPIAQLQLTMNGATVPVYQVLLAQPGLNAGALSDPANVTGDPDFGNAGASRVNSTVGGATPNPWGTTNVQHRVLPANGAYSGPNASDQGFYVLGPQPPAIPNGTARFFDPADNPNFQATLRSAQMSYPVPLNSIAGANPVMPSVDIVLQRLACPHLPPNPLPGKPGNNPNLPVNPYITTDLLELTGKANNDPTTQVWDSRRFQTAPGAITPPGVRANRHSYRRLQPYAASQALRQQAPNPVPVTNPPEAQSTFFRHNSTQPAGPPAPTTIAAGDTLKTSFDWLTHLDRRLISPMELVNVAGVKPHELTAAFQRAPSPPPLGYNPQTQSSNPSPHLARWTSSDGRLYRFLEFASTGSFQNGYALGGRVPGKININTMSPADLEVFRAIVDAQQGNTFYTAGAATDTTVVDPIFNALIARRSPGAGGVPGAGGAANPDNPYLSLATGHSGVNDAVSIAQRSLNDTVLRPVAPGLGFDGKRMLEPTYPTTPFITPNGPYPATATQSTIYHAYQRYELLNKIYNNLTVRSNVFAVFMTVGFFEVEDERTTPVTLGAEIGRSENRHVRHRSFAVVDRTHLQMASTNLKPTLKWTVTGQTSFVDLDLDGPTGILVATQGINTASNLQWIIQPGTVLTVTPNSNTEENVTVFRNQTTGRLQARFFKGHGNGNPNPAVANATVIIRGNPGPRFRYNPRGDTNVVPYFAIID